MNKRKIKKLSATVKSKLKAVNGSLSALVSRKADLALLGLAALMLITAASAPSLHNSYIRTKVGSKVYLVRTSPNGGGGTGFMVKAPSGKSYMMTNDHVCAASKSGLDMVVMDEKGDWIPRKILHKSDKTDLCILEGMPGVEGLTLASEPATGQTVLAVGHPGLMPLTLSSGEVIGTRDVTVIHFITLDKNDPNCQGSKSSMVEIGSKITLTPKEITFTPVYGCLATTKNAYITNVVIRPGSSGSPMVNWRGQVQGVMFAGDAFGWGIAVSLSDVRDMLKLY